MSRAESKARTRALLLQAAGEVFARKGFEGASVDEIAEAAGFSIGALYSNFSGKEDLFLALLEEHSAEHLREVERILTEEPPGEGRRRALGRYLVHVAETHRGWAELAGEFWLYAVRNPAVVDRYALRWRMPRRMIAEIVTREIHGCEVDPSAVATVILALFDGLVDQRRVDPDSVPETLFGDALAWLTAGIAAAPSHRGERS